MSQWSLFESCIRVKDKHSDTRTWILTYVVYEALDLGLHAPVSELHLAELVGAHDDALTRVVVDLLDPVLWQRAPSGFEWLVQLGVFFHQVFMGRDVVLDDVYRVLIAIKHNGLWQIRTADVTRTNNELPEEKCVIFCLLCNQALQKGVSSRLNISFAPQWILVCRASTPALTLLNLRAPVLQHAAASTANIAVPIWLLFIKGMTITQRIPEEQFKSNDLESGRLDR